MACTSAAKQKLLSMLRARPVPIFFSFRKYNAQMKRPSGKFTSRNRLNFRRRDEDKSWL